MCRLTLAGAATLFGDFALIRAEAAAASGGSSGGSLRTARGRPVRLEAGLYRLHAALSVPFLELPRLPQPRRPESVPLAWPSGVRARVRRRHRNAAIALEHRPRGNWRCVPTTPTWTWRTALYALNDKTRAPPNGTSHRRGCLGIRTYSISIRKRRTYRRLRQSARASTPTRALPRASPAPSRQPPPPPASFPRRRSSRHAIVSAADLADVNAAIGAEWASARSRSSTRRNTAFRIGSCARKLRAKTSLNTIASSARRVLETQLDPEPEPAWPMCHAIVACLAGGEGVHLLPGGLPRRRLA